MALDQSNFRPEWLQLDISRQMVVGAIALAREGKDVNATSVIAKARISVSDNPGLLPEVIKIFKNGYGAASVDDAIQHSYEVHVNNRAIQVANEILHLSRTDPHGIQKWLSREATSMVNLIHQGDTYDPRPSVHAAKRLPGRLTQSWITGMDELLRGGYRDAYFGCYAGVTSHGKSVTLRSHVVDLVLQKFKVALIITENTESTASAMIAASMTGVDYDAEVVTKKFKATERETSEERHQRYDHTLEYLDEYLLVYGPDHFSDDGLQRIARWEHPNVMVADYLKKQPGLFKKSSNSQDEVGDFADWLLKFAMDVGVCFITAGQMSKDAAKKFIKSGNLEDIILYGTARVEYASDQFMPLRRHPRIKNTAEFWTKKYRHGGDLNTRHEIPLDKKRSLLQIKRLQLQDPEETA